MLAPIRCVFCTAGRLRGKGDGWGGCGRGGKKLLGPDMVLPAPPALHLDLKDIVQTSSTMLMAQKGRVVEFGKRVGQAESDQARGEED